MRFRLGLIIGFAVTSLLLAMAYRVYRTHRSVDLEALSRRERDVEEELERGAAIEREEAVQRDETVGAEPDRGDEVRT